jgi:hypothetical protein
LDLYYNYEKKVVDVEGLRTIASSLSFSSSFREVLLSMLREEE